MATVVQMPAVVADAEDAVLTSWLVTEGERVAKGQALAEIETDKANVEVTADTAGIAGRLLVAAGERVAVGAAICVLLAEGETDLAIAAALGAPPAVGGEATKLDEPVEALPAEKSSDRSEGSGAPRRIFASPLARRIAAEHGLELAAITGRGPRGRIIRADVAAALAARQERSHPDQGCPQQVAPSPAPALGQPGYTDLPLSRMRKAIARRLTESKSTVPHFYVSVDVRADELLKFRQQLNSVSPVKISVNDLIVKAVGSALMAVPAANAIWCDTAIRLFDSADISVAVSTDTGLATPVVRGVDKLGLMELADSTRELISRARAGKLKQSEIEGGSFTVSNMGMYAVREFSAILNPPQSGILAVGAAEQRPVVTDGQLAVATLMTCTLSCDHRVIDGALGAQLLQAIKTRLEQPALLAL